MAPTARTAPGRGPNALRLGRLLRLRRAVLARRRLLAASFAALAVLTLGRALHAPGPVTRPVLVAAEDLPGGLALEPEDVRVVELPVDAAPAGAVGRSQDAVGRVLAAPVRTGEPLTDVRMVGPALLAGYPGTVAAPVRLADPALLDLLRVGDRVELLASDPTGGTAALSLGRAPVVALPGDTAGAAAAAAGQGGVVVLALPPESAARVAQAAVTRVLSAVLVH